MDITTQYYRLGLFQDSDFTVDLEDSKSTSLDFFVFIESRIFVPVN